MLQAAISELVVADKATYVSERRLSTRCTFWVCTNFCAVRVWEDAGESRLLRIYAQQLINGFPLSRKSAQATIL